MNLEELKLYNLGIEKDKFGKIFSFVDFGNVNYWFEKDRRDWQDNNLRENQKLIVDIEKMANFLNIFSTEKRFYYGWHQRIKKSWHIIIKAERNGFIKVTKPIQFIKHYLEGEDLKEAKINSIKEDFYGKYIEIQKSNFDIEISVDSIRIMKKYDTFCLMSGDSDFARLVDFLKKENKKKIIIIAAGQVLHTLKDNVDLYINAQKIKGLICRIKETPPLKRRGLDIGSISDGQGSF